MTKAPNPEDVFEEAAAEEAAGGMPGGGGEGGGPLSRLFDGAVAGPSVQELQMDYDLPREFAIAGRGVMRVATGSGVPPAFEILLGTAMAVFKGDGPNIGGGDADGTQATTEPEDGYADGWDA